MAFGPNDSERTAVKCLFQVALLELHTVDTRRRYCRVRLRLRWTDTRQAEKELFNTFF